MSTEREREIKRAIYLLDEERIAMIDAGKPIPLALWGRLDALHKEAADLNAIGYRRHGIQANFVGAAIAIVWLIVLTAGFWAPAPAYHGHSPRDLPLFENARR